MEKLSGQTVVHRSQSMHELTSRLDLCGPLHDGRVVVDLAGMAPRVAAELLQIGAHLDALQAFAAEATLRFFTRLFGL